MYGFRLGEHKLPMWTTIKPSFKIEIHTERLALARARLPVGVSLGPIAHVALPKPDLDDWATLVGGVLKRFAYQPGDPTPGILARMNRFIRRKILPRLTPLPQEEDVTVETWLEHTNYPDWRRQELLDVYHKQVIFGPATLREARINCFTKDEGYIEFKQARAINARDDPMKVRLGPIFKAIENAVYAMPEFIKHVPVHERGQYMKERLQRAGVKYVASDFSSYESLFTKALMQAVERELYDYMTQHLPCHDEFIRMVDDFLLGKNNIVSKFFKAQIEATRMSGEMCTSLGNGFSTMCFFYFVCDECGFTEVSLVVEGDDNAASGVGTPPTKEDFAKLGLVIKLEVFTSPSDMSFCGLVFDEQDEQIVTDPRKVVANFGWASRQYVRARTSKLKTLLRCKSLSLAYQYPGCPIVTALAHYGLRVTAGHDVRSLISTSKSFDSWERGMLQEAAAAPLVREEPRPGTRALTERLFGITISDQMRMEGYFDGKNDLMPIDDPVFLDTCHSDWHVFYHSNTLDIDYKANNLDAGVWWPQANNDRQTLLEEIATRVLKPHR